METKTKKLLLENYKKMYEAMKKSMDKQRIGKLITELEKDLNISLLNRLNVFCNINQKVVCIPSFKLGSIANKDTLYYDLTILKKNQISTFLKPIKDGWCASYL